MSDVNEHIDDEQPTRARRVGVEALEQVLHGEATDAVDISLYVKGRMIATTTNAATVHRIMAILSGLAE